MTDEQLMETLYKALNSNTKPIVDITVGGAFMDCTFTEETEILDRLTKITRALNTMDSVVTSSIYSVRV